MEIIFKHIEYLIIGHENWLNNTSLRLSNMFCFLQEPHHSFAKSNAGAGYLSFLCNIQGNNQNVLQDVKLPRPKETTSPYQKGENRVKLSRKCETQLAITDTVEPVLQISYGVCLWSYGARSANKH